MKLIKVGAAVLNQTPRDWEGNFTNIRDAIELAKKEGVSVLCLPEACITGYGLEDDLFCADLTTRAIQRLARITGLCDGIVVCVGLPIRFNNALYAGVATIVDGDLAGITCKQHLAGDGIHYEPRHFKPWPTGVVAHMDLGIVGMSLHIPIGDVYFNVAGIKIGYEICEDAWVARRPGIALAGKGIDIIMNPSGSHFSFGKLETRKDFVVDGSRAFNCTYIYSNLVGLEAGRAIYDGGSLIASGGKLLAIGKRFTFKNVLLTTAVIDTDTTRTQQVRSASFEPNIVPEDRSCIYAPFDWSSAHFPETMEQSIEQESWENSPDLKHEECSRAIALALMDYMRKSRTNGFVISLSGGADSAMVTQLCAKGIELGVAELGIDKFIKKYCVNPESKAHVCPRTVKFLIRWLITTAYQATAQSSDVTKNAASAVAKELGTTHFEFDVEPMVKAYAALAEQVKNIGRPADWESAGGLTFEDDGLVLQNLQARVRAPGIWMIANMEKKLLLTTSNMSEAAVGYATMDGDTAGCVAPIAGLPKCYIREYLRWAERDLLALNLVNNQQPTAELLPSTFNQTDEKDLMPYPLLHKIEGMVVKNRYSPLEIYRRLRLEPDLHIANDTLVNYITKFFRLFSINQWKRERYALSFHMDDHNLDPRTWCRTPILTGGYEEELKDLEQNYTTYRGWRQS